jgi:mannose-6-phosphate isomerase
VYIGPLAFKEIFKAKPWGGRALARVAGKRLPAGLIGESWEIADHPNGVSVVRGGPLEGWTLRRLMQHHRRGLVGANSDRRFPLIVKLLDARRRLSVQVHPDDAQARALKLPDCGKMESWYVLESRAGGELVAGLKSRRDVARLEELVRSGQIEGRLRREHPQAEQAWLCEARTLHALGPGLVLIEVQQNSDATLRLYDWGRMGPDGKARPIHLRECRFVLGLGGADVRRLRPSKLRKLPFPATRLADTHCFVMDRWSVSRATEREKPERFEILYVLSGSGRLQDGVWPELVLRKGVTVLVPADVGCYSIRPRRKLEIIRMAGPENEHAA